MRFPRGPELERVFREGAVIHGPFFVVRWLPTDGPSRLAIAAGKKAAPGAVERNRLRRRLREASRGAFPAAGVHVVVLARAAAGTADFTALVDAARAAAAEIASKGGRLA